MGLVCAQLLAADRPGAPAGPTNLTLWSHSPENAGDLLQTRASIRLPGYRLHDRVRVTSDLRKALDHAELVVSAIPVQYMRPVWTTVASSRLVGSGACVLSVAKGIENDSLLRPTEIVASLFPSAGAPPTLGVLSGPTIAAELARGLPAVMIAASDTPGFAEVVQALFTTSYLRIYTHDDTLGVELAGAMKNVIAIAAGVIDGLQAGTNAKSALLARGLAEITRLGLAMGARPETFFGLAGAGDLATTCFAPEGRNRSLGEALGRGKALADYLKQAPYVVEGVATTRSVMDLARRHQVDMPITQAVHALLFEGLDAIEGIGRLMSRENKPERVG
jgi:glycerol-3-phosphate dehydrogenase (NAD(P)+)